jgi:hypothetical protein
MRDIEVRPIVWTGVAFAGVVALAVVVVLTMLHFVHVPPGGERSSFGDSPQQAAPGLASAPQDEMSQYRREKQAQLDSAGWVDRQAGIAHIPIADAMDLLVQQRAQKGGPQ